MIYMPCKKKKKSLKECLEEAFHHRWLPAQEYEIPDPYAEQLKGLPKQNQVIHVHACVLAHRAANIKSNVLLVTDAGSASWKAARLQEDTSPEMKQNSEILCLSRAGDLRFLMPTEILCLQRIFRNIVVALVAKLPQRRPGFLHPSNCNAASGCSLLCACLRAGSGKLFVFNELPWRPPSRPGTVDHAFLCRWQLPSHHFPSAKGFGDVVTHRFLLHSARPRRWALGISSQPPHSLLSACCLRRLATHLFPFDLI